MPRKSGRPPKLDATRAAFIVNCIVAGRSHRQAAELAQVHRGTLQAWLERGEREKSGPYHDFYVKMSEARAMYAMAFDVKWFGACESARDFKDYAERHPLLKHEFSKLGDKAAARAADRPPTAVDITIRTMAQLPEDVRAMVKQGPSDQSLESLKAFYAKVLEKAGPKAFRDLFGLEPQQVFEPVRTVSALASGGVE